ncbi:MAG: hypothetical protein VB087_11455 [Candidatus Limiplasma sp.]|nr:hypothetical protein [Candidatus Limiplasma sp.]
MSGVILLLRFAALCVSVMGYAGFSRAFLSVPVYYSYLVSLSWISCAMFVAGLLGVLSIAAYILLGLGFLLLLVVMAARRFSIAFRRPTLSMINVLYILWFWFTFASLINYRLIHYDNFSHWALVVKQMLLTDAIPDAASRLIDFKNYPLGTSSFLYFVCKVVGKQEGVMLVGQGMLIFACFYALNGVVRDHKRFLLAAIIGLTSAVMSYFNVSIRVNNLLVDYLLPLFALGMIAGITESGQNYRVACLASIPVLGMLLIIKNTGVFFAVPAILYLFYAGRTARQGQPLAKKAAAWALALLAIAASFGTMVLWSLHTARAFAGESAKFSVDIASLLTLDPTNLAALAPDKSPEDIRAIIQLYIQSVTNLSALATQGMLLINIVGITAWLNARLGFGKKWKLLRVLVLMDILMLVYYAGILTFYLVAMPRDEALRLAGFERYASSMMLFVIGAVGLCMTRDVERSLHVQQGELRDYRAFKSLQTKRIYQNATMAVFATAMLFLATDLQGMNALQEGYPSTLPAHAERVLGNQWEQADTRRYLLYAPDTDRQITDDYLLYVGRYMLMDPDVYATDAADDTLLEQLRDFDYFVIVESDAAIQTLMQGQLGLDGDVGVYSVTELFEGVTLSALTPRQAVGNAR